MHVWKYIEVGIRQWGYTVKLDYAVVARMMYVEVGYKGGAKGAACSQPGVHRSLVFLLLQFPLKAMEHCETETMQATRDWVSTLCSN